MPYVPYWSFGEQLPVLEEDADDPETISYAFETLAALVARGFAGSGELVDSRDAYVKRVSEHGRGERPVKIFLSYARQDQRLVQELTTHLRPLERSGLSLTWHDRMIRRGAAWEKEISSAMERVDIFLVFVSADFLASDFIWEKEMARALRRHEEGKMQIVPIILRSVAWESTPLAAMQALPTNGRPVTLWSNRDEAWAQVVQAIDTLAAGLRSHPRNGAPA